MFNRNQKIGTIILICCIGLIFYMGYWTAEQEYSSSNEEILSSLSEHLNSFPPTIYDELNDNMTIKEFKQKYRIYVQYPLVQHLVIKEIREICKGK